MLFSEAVEFTYGFRTNMQINETFLISSIPGSIYYSGIQIYTDNSVRVCKLDSSNGTAIDNLTLKSLLHRIV